MKMSKIEKLFSEIFFKKFNFFFLIKNLHFWNIAFSTLWKFHWWSYNFYRYICKLSTFAKFNTKRLTLLWLSWQKKIPINGKARQGTTICAFIFLSFHFIASKIPKRETINMRNMPWSFNKFARINKFSTRDNVDQSMRNIMNKRILWFKLYLQNFAFAFLMNL